MYNILYDIQPPVKCLETVLFGCVANQCAVIGLLFVHDLLSDSIRGDGVFCSCGSDKVDIER